MDPAALQALRQEALSFIKDQKVGVVATIAKDSTPEAASVNYLIEDDWSIYILTDQNSRKVENIKNNPHVAFVSGTSLAVHTAQVQGTAEIIDSNNSLYEGFAKKLSDTKKLDEDPMYSVFGGNYVILKIKVEWLRWLSFDKSSGKPVYTVLIPENAPQQ